MGFEDDFESNVADFFSDADSGNDDVFSEMSDYEKNNFNEFVADRTSKAPKMHGCIPEVDLNITEFQPVEKFFEDVPNETYNNPKYYKQCLTGEGPASQRLHELLIKYLNCQDKSDRTVYRQQIIPAYWQFLQSLATKIGGSDVPDCKRMAMRYGVLLPSLFTPEQKQMFARAIDKNVSCEPVLYMDEWMRSIALGHLSPSSTDEAPVKASMARSADGESMRLQQLKSKNSGKLQTTESLLTGKETERNSLETSVKSKIQDIFMHSVLMGLEPHKDCYTEIQRKLFSDVINDFRQLQKIDKDMAKYLEEFREAKEVERSLEEKIGLAGVEVNVAKEAIVGELNTVRQMSKMTCGRQGNQFPIFTKEFFHCFDKGTGFRENVIRELAWIESIDPQCFCRIHKNVPHRIVPFVLLVPSYGDAGICWEPFDRFNRLSSRGRICIPMYPRDLKTACLTAVADLRWQVAKEKASFDWMTDGLTGHYYQYLEEHKMKGDIKQFFIDDYILWMTKESNGTQKLEKEVRAIFWRYLPFPQEIKDELKKRSLVYQELYQRDVNRSMSDGY